MIMMIWVRNLGCLKNTIYKKKKRNPPYISLDRFLASLPTFKSKWVGETD